MIEFTKGALKDLQKFYDEYCKSIVQEYDEGSLAYLNALRKYSKEKKIEIVREHGIGTGLSFAALALEKPKVLIGYDLKLFNYSYPFEQFARKNNIELRINKNDANSVNSVGESDLLHIDSVYRQETVYRELINHANSVSKYIVISNTNNYGPVINVLGGVIKFITVKDPQWQIVEHGISGRGYVVLRRVIK